MTNSESTKEIVRNLRNAISPLGNAQQKTSQRRDCQNPALPYDVRSIAKMPADGFQWLYGSNVNKLFEEAKEQKHILQLQETGPFSKQTGWPDEKHRPQKAGPINLRYRMASCEKVGSEPEAVNATIIDGVEVRVTDTESIKRLPGIKADNLDKFKTGGRDWKD